MNVYKIPIETAFIVFPIIAFIFTIPYIIHQYNRYGSVIFLRSLIVYSLILYLISAYFLVILPLPSIESVQKLTTPIMQLHPFTFASDIIKETSFNLTNFSSYLPSLKNSYVYTVLFNIILTLPFGVYLRYYFKSSLKKTILLTFILSLFFELTQLSGLYGLYPRPYRLFDVDDLIINTLGGLFGYIIAPIFMKILPSRSKLDNKSYEKGKKITLFRRGISFLIDFFFLNIISVITRILLYQRGASNYSFVIALIIYFLILPLFFEGQTFGKIIIKIKLRSKNDEKPKFYQIFFRYLLGYFFFIYFYTWNNFIDLIPNELLKEVINTIMTLYIIINLFYLFLLIIKKKKNLLYEEITKTKLSSGVQIEEPKEEIKTEEKKCQIRPKRSII